MYLFVLLLLCSPPAGYIYLTDSVVWGRNPTHRPMYRETPLFLFIIILVACVVSFFCGNGRIKSPDPLRPATHHMHSCVRGPLLQSAQGPSAHHADCGAGSGARAGASHRHSHGRTPYILPLHRVHMSAPAPPRPRSRLKARPKATRARAVGDQPHHRGAEAWKWRRACRGTHPPPPRRASNPVHTSPGARTAVIRRHRGYM